MLKPGAMLARSPINYDRVMIRQRYSACVKAGLRTDIVVLQLQVVIEKHAVKHQQVMRLIARNHARRNNFKSRTRNPFDPGDAPKSQQKNHEECRYRVTRELSKRDRP